MMSFLILPVQRVPRYELLARDIQRKADLFPDLLYGTGRCHCVFGVDRPCVWLW